METMKFLGKLLEAVDESTNEHKNAQTKDDYIYTMGKWMRINKLLNGLKNYNKKDGKNMKVGDRVKTKNKPWSPLDSWTVEEIYGNRVYLVRYEGCGMSATVRDFDTLELIDDYFSK